MVRPIPKKQRLLHIEPSNSLPDLADGESLAGELLRIASRESDAHVSKAVSLCPGAQATVTQAFHALYTSKSPRYIARSFTHISSSSSAAIFTFSPPNLPALQCRNLNVCVLLYSHSSAPLLTHSQLSASDTSALMRDIWPSSTMGSEAPPGENDADSGEEDELSSPELRVRRRTRHSERERPSPDVTQLNVSYLVSSISSTVFSDYSRRYLPCK